MQVVPGERCIGLGRACGGRGIRRSQLGAARRLQHPQPIGLAEREVLPQPLEVLALRPGGRQESSPRRGRHDDRRDRGGEREAGRDERGPVAVDEREHDEQRLDEHAEVREDRERHAGPGHAALCHEPCAGERVLGVLHERAEPPRERTAIRGEAPHPPVGVLGPEQRLEQRDLVGCEHHVRRHLDADRLALRAGEQAHLALHGEVDEGSGCRPPVGVHEQRVVQHRGAPLGRVLHDRCGHPLRGDGARNDPQHEDEGGGRDREHDDGREHAPSLGMRPAATSPRRAPGRACRRRSPQRRDRGTAAAWSSARSGGRPSAA